MLGSLADEFKGCSFGDKRLTRRVISLADSISENPELSINAACGAFSASKGAYRFLQNDKVNPAAILNSHLENTRARVAKIRSRILIVQDTTDLIYTQFPSIRGLGVKLQSKEGYKDDVQGITLHSSLAISTDGIPLGILKQTFFTNNEIREKRAQEQINIRGVHKHVLIEQKASYRWIDHLTSTNRVLESCPTEIVHVADRECDIYEFLQAAADQKSLFVVRSSTNRRTHEGPVRDSSTIEEKLAVSAVLGKTSINIDRSEITCQIKTATAFLRPPQRSGKAKSMDLQPISVGVVDIMQEGSVPEPIHWCLLTNLPVATIDDAMEVLLIYKQRWSIECFHRILKSGFGVEAARLGNRQRLENLTSLLSIVSWHIYWLYQFGRKMPDLEAKKIFDPLTITVLKTSAKNLKIGVGSILTVGECVQIIARLGGFLGRKGDGDPGMMSIWRGWRNLHERIEFMEALTCG